MALTVGLTAVMTVTVAEAFTDGSWTEVAVMVTAPDGANGGAVYVPVFSPMDPLLLLVPGVQVGVPLELSIMTHQTTAV
ncbi:MAG: hypothetical protein WBE97_01145, partial [Candidatus Acidiferrales bacterium]